jgi:hypothetical protein
MSQKYLVLTLIEGRIRMLSLTSNLSEPEDLRRLCGNMLADFFKGRKVDGFLVEPWSTVVSPLLTVPS